jgi:hypothetical protein
MAHRNNNNHSRDSIPAMDDDILDLCTGDGEEQQEEDPNDDDVRTHEDVANDSNNREENATTANIFD